MKRITSVIILFAMMINYNILDVSATEVEKTDDRNDEIFCYLKWTNNCVRNL